MRKKIICSTLHAWLLIHKRNINKLCKANPSSRVLRQPRDLSWHIEALWKANDLSPADLPSEGPRGAQLQEHPSFSTCPWPSLSFPTSMVSQSGYCVSPALFLITWVPPCAAVEALSVMSLVWKVIHGNKLHCVLGPWQSTSIIMSVRDFIIAWGPWCQNQGRQWLQNRLRATTKFSQWSHGFEVRTEVLVLSNSHTSSLFICRLIVIKEWKAVLLLFCFVSLIIPGKWRLL